MIRNDKIHGVYAAMLTPLNSDGSINYKETRRLTDFLINKGVDGIFPVSSIGEGISFDIEESVELAKTVYETADKRVDVIPGATTSCTYNTVKLTERMNEFGCDTVVIAPPYFYSTSDADIVKHYSEVVGRTAVNVIAYNIPLFTTPISDSALQELLKIDKVIGIKDSSGSGVKLMQILDNVHRSNAGTSILVGREEMFLSGLQMGADGCIVGSASIIPEVIAAIKNAFDSGNLELAKSYQQSIVKLVKNMFLLPFPLGFKIALEKRGFHMGGIRKSIDYGRIGDFEEIEKRIEKSLSDVLNNFEKYGDTL